ncbi:related to RAD26 - DNA repair and recombination protein [Pseudozyma flocculosa]|uniref:Related to RAD26 - DNA repair and recombination protein n=1 Tax=Pseudozyma flocculosa TaxID=84751 RepID=A0A5C3FBI5_9BASI|nr:related to RAD26 - DNA repair and recombination protein [Pseudozyma flocculosa]
MVAQQSSRSRAGGSRAVVLPKASERDTKRKRKRQTRPRRNPGRLRALLGFGPNDDYIETGPISSTSSSDDDSDSHDDQDGDHSDHEGAGGSRVATRAQVPAVTSAFPTASTRSPTPATGPSAQPADNAHSDSSEEEYVLSMAPKRAVAAPKLAESSHRARQDAKQDPKSGREHPGPVVGTDHSSLSDTESDDDGGEYSLTRSESYRNVSAASLPLFTTTPAAAAATTAQRPESPSSSSDDELVLTLRPSTKQAAARPGPTVAPRAEPSTAADGPAALDQGQRPAFSVSAEQARVGPLELGPGCVVPASINRFLRDYQRDGVRFFYKSYQERRGALLGDDMGLGKTIQVIAFLSAIMAKTGLESDADRRIEAVRSGRQGSGFQKANGTWPTCLIICPSSVIDNWRGELDTWGYFEHAAFTGAKGRAAIEAFRRARLDILVTSHETAALNIDQLEDLDLSCVLIDEAHKLKNPKSQLTQAMHQFKCPLYTLADWTNPGLLGDVKEWHREIEQPLKTGQRRDASDEHIADARTRAEKLVQNVLPLFFLRRTKSLIQDQLPQKFDKVVFCPLSKTQLDVYRRILAEPEVDFMLRHADPCDCGVLDQQTQLPFRRQNCCYSRDSNGDPWNKHMLKYIYLLQKCSNHVALVFPDPEDATAKEAERNERYERQLSYVKLMFPDDWKDKRCNAANGMKAEYCGKWNVLAGLLRQWRTDGDKVLLFSTNIRLLQFIEFFIIQEGHSFCRLDGSTPQAKRQDLVDKFNRDPDVFIFLISTTAGGTGLNLTAANKVVVFDPHWNPSHDLQAMDRAYRFGQTRDVNVYRLIGAGSLEECVYGRQIYKQQQMAIGYTATKERRYFEGVAGDKENIGELFGVKNLFNLQESGIGTKSIIDECNIAEVSFALKRYLDKAKPGEASATADDETLLELANGESATQIHEAKVKDEDDVEDPIKSILDSVGVRYTHLNDQVTGGSKTEARISRQAKRATLARDPRRPPSTATSGSSTRTKAKRTATTSGAVWPPPRPKVGEVPGSTAAGHDLADGAQAMPSSPVAAKERPGLGAAAARRTDFSLEKIAELEGLTEAEVAARIREMSNKEQTVYFDRALQRLARSAHTLWTAAVEDE